MLNSMRDKNEGTYRGGGGVYKLSTLVRANRGISRPPLGHPLVCPPVVTLILSCFTFRLHLKAGALRVTQTKAAVQWSLPGIFFVQPPRAT